MSDLAKWMNRAVGMLRALDTETLLGQYRDGDRQMVFAIRDGRVVCTVATHGSRGLIGALVLLTIGLGAEVVLAAFGDAVVTTERNPVTNRPWRSSELEFWWERLQQVDESPCLTRVLGLIGVAHDGSLQERLWRPRFGTEGTTWDPFGEDLSRLRTGDVADIARKVLSELPHEKIRQGFQLPSRGEPGTESEHDQAWRDVEFFVAMDRGLSQHITRWQLCAEADSLRSDILTSALAAENVGLN